MKLFDDKEIKVLKKESYFTDKYKNMTLIRK